MNRSQVVELSRVRQLVRSGAAQKIRVASGISQGELASAIGVSAAAVSRWEHRLRVPRGKPAIRYGRLLDELLTGSSR